MSNSQTKLIVLGNSDLIKREFVAKLFRREPTSVSKTPILGYEVYNENSVDCWIIAGNEKYLGLGEGYCMEANYGIIFSNCAKQTKRWKKLCPENCHVIVVCNSPEGVEKAKESFLTRNEY